MLSIKRNPSAKRKRRPLGRIALAWAVLDTWDRGIWVNPYSGALQMFATLEEAHRARLGRRVIRVAIREVKPKRKRAPKREGEPGRKT